MSRKPTGQKNTTKRRKPKRPGLSSLAAQVKALISIQMKVITEQNSLRSEIDLLWQVLIDNRIVSKEAADAAAAHLAALNASLREAAGLSPAEAVAGFLAGFEGPKQ